MLVSHKLGLHRPIYASLALASLFGCATSEGVAGDNGAGGATSPDAGVDGASPGSSGGSGGTQLEIDAGKPPTKPIGGIPQTCDDALTVQSYIGCEYWPTVTLNSALSESFDFAIVAANPTKAPAHLKVERAGQLLAEADVAPGELATIELPWVAELKQTRAAPTQPLKSALVPGGAFHVTSSVPVVLYQFNPLEFEKGPPPPPNCVIDLATNACMSWSNDASLLLPTSALTSDYRAVTRPSFHVGDEFASGNIEWYDYPSFIAVTATQPDTHVNVQSRSAVRAGDGVMAMAAESGQSFLMQRGDVLLLAAEQLAPDAPVPAGEPCAEAQVYIANYHLCVATPDHDFTGSKITADAPISVIAGHDCTMVPYGKWACDHLEESMLPTESLGTELVVTAPQSTAAVDAAGSVDPTYVRIVSGGDDNQIEFDPPSIHPKLTLGDGEYVEVGPVTEDFVVRGSNRLLVAQFFTGKNATGYPVEGEVGDPSETLAIPSEQFRKEYTFLAPVSYTYNFVNVFAKAGTPVEIDGTPIPESEFSAVGNSGYVVARHAVPGGAHAMSSSTGSFGIVVYGYGNFTSYAYPGGLNLEPVIITPR
jgi:IgGFc binding protein